MIKRAGSALVLLMGFMLLIWAFFRGMRDEFLILFFLYFGFAILQTYWDKRVHFALAAMFVLYPVIRFFMGQGNIEYLVGWLIACAVLSWLVLR